MNRNESGLPFLAAGLLLALVLIFLSFRSSPPNEAVLSQRFAPQPTVAGAPTPAPFELPRVTLPELPPDTQQNVSKIREALAGGQPAPALTPVAQGGGVTVTVRDLNRVGDQVSVRGSVRNGRSAPLAIGPEAFGFRDSAGTSYTTQGSGATELQPGQETDFDLSVPLPEGRGLILSLSIPPDPPIEQTLLVEVSQ